MTTLMQALRYPWQGEGRWGQMLSLALLQFIPVVGQLILVGYGQAVARATHKRRRSLPTLHLGRALVDGLRWVAVGLIYCFPVLLTLLMTFSTSSAPEPETSGGVPGIVYPIAMFSYLRLSGEIAKRKPALEPVVALLNRLFSAVFFVFIILRLFDLFTTLRGGLQFSAIQLDGAGMITILMASLLLAIVSVALLVSGVRFAITGEGLLQPKTTLQLMVANRRLTLRFIFTVWLLAAGTFVATAIGAVFLLLPGFLLMVAGNLSIWFLATQYAINIGIKPEPVQR